MKIGDLRETVTLNRPEIVDTDPLGHPVVEMEWVATVWARVEPVKGDESFRAGGIEATHENVFHIRYRADIEATWTLNWRGRVYNIVAWSNPDERRRFTAIHARAKS